jgi:hypothetical protein
VQVSSVEGGLVKLMYCPKENGPTTLTIKVRGEHITGSPFALHVGPVPPQGSGQAGSSAPLSTAERRALLSVDQAAAFGSDESLRLSFEAIDTDKNGRLDREEIVLALRRMKKTEVEIQRLLDDVAIDEIDFGQFKALVTVPATEEQATLRRKSLSVPPPPAVAAKTPPPPAPATQAADGDADEKTSAQAEATKSGPPPPPAPAAKTPPPPVPAAKAPPPPAPAAKAPPPPAPAAKALEEDLDQPRSNGAIKSGVTADIEIRVCACACAPEHTFPCAFASIF